MSTVKVKQDDVGVLFTGTLTSNGAPLPLSGATVLFLMKKGTTLISKQATIVSAPAGTVSYTSVAGDLATRGTFLQEWEATFPDGRKITFPSSGYNKVIVGRDLN